MKAIMVMCLIPADDDARFQPEDQKVPMPNFQRAPSVGSAVFDQPPLRRSMPCIPARARNRVQYGQYKFPHRLGKVAGIHLMIPCCCHSATYIQYSQGLTTTITADGGGATIIPAIRLWEGGTLRTGSMPGWENARDESGICTL